MDENIAVDRLVEQVIEYARGRHNDVERGAETPRLAALLLQKYGRGMADAVALIFETPRAADRIVRQVDEETSRIDPAWREHDRERWAARPADIVDPHNMRP